MLTYTLPAAAGEELRWRHATMDKAKARAAELGQKGAMFPWRSINGDECSGYWPAGTAGVHVSADIANAVAKYPQCHRRRAVRRRVRRGTAGGNRTPVLGHRALRHA